MKRSVLMVVAVMVGSMAMMTGCKSSSDEASQKDSAAQETTTPAQTPAQDSAAQAPAKSDESTTIKASVGVDFNTPRYAPSAPPAPRYEPVRRPPSERHIWVKGYWKWTGREWLWVGGHWDVKRGNRTYVEPHYDYEHGRYRYMPGHWVRR